MRNELFKQIEYCLDTCDSVLSKEKKDAAIVVKTKIHKGRFTLTRFDSDTVSVLCAPLNGYGTYYRFNLARSDDDNRIAIKLYSYDNDDAFGAMGEDYYRKLLVKLVECVEHYVANVPQPNELMQCLLDNYRQLHPFVPMPSFETPGVKAFVFKGETLMIYVAGLEDKLVLSVITGNSQLINLYAVSRKDNSLLEIERLNYKETVLPDKVVLAVNKFVTKLNSHQPQESY